MSKYEEILKKYEESANNTSTGSGRKFDLKNYFNTFLKEGVKQGTEKIRILPGKEGAPFYTEIMTHSAKIDGKKKVFACLKHLNDEDCPFCEARAELLATGTDGDKELAKTYGARKMYIIRVIDRNAEEEGVKFWRFNHDYSKKGTFDKIIGIINTLKTDIDDPNTGRDLTINLGRDHNGYVVITSIVHNDPTPLTKDKTKGREWLADERTWRDVYSVKNYQYLEIVVKGGVPMYDKVGEKWIDKAAVSKDNDTSADELNNELTMGNQKSQPTTPVTQTVDTDDDDLPF